MSQLEGVKDVFNNLWLVLRCATIGAGLGAVPGIGASVVDWIAYGHAARTEKGAALTFGKGDVRGVIASESSNNAKEGGALVPTIAFGVPGSASMALILGAFLIHGLVPGPEMLTKNLDVTYTMVWSVAIANIFGAGICFVFANQLAKIALVRVGILAPTVLAIVFIGAFQGSRQWGDLYALLIFGALGWTMKRLRWPRPPLILGFVLGGLIENYMFISVTRYGADWLSRPWVMVIFAMTLYGILAPIVRGYRARGRAPSGGRVFGFQRQNLNPDMAFCLAVIGLFGACIYLSSDWEFAAQLVPQVVGWAGVIFTGVLLISGLFVAPGEKPATAGANPTGPGESQEARGQSDMHFDIQVDFGDLSKRTILTRAATYFAWCLFFLGAAAVVGILPALLLFLIGNIRFEGKESWKMTLAVALPVWGLSYILFHRILRILWPHAVIGDWFPALRSIQALNLF
ncbi:MAG: tripartite tricarboxylate transporter permease [Proteobacteria bacterium]|nr:tripartite tricarboxylate transporter permease [Pseudomonadota bacterium]